MAIDTFKYCIQVQSNGGSATEENSAREVSFGNGYVQVASAGFNVSRRSFNVVYAALDWAAMQSFCRSHVITPFIWTTPEGDVGLFRVKAGTIASKVVSRKVREINCVFVEQFTAMK
ncbi:tail fiber protein [Erwinia phage Snitter]|nr:tail fiber protein [Erwinia phage Snitter]